MVPERVNCLDSSLSNKVLAIEAEVFPTFWKKANVCPVKKGNVAIVSNYRPISLLSTLSKVFERAVYVHLLNHLSYNNSLTEYHSGFLPGDSALNQLTYLYHQLCEAIDSGKEIRAVFCDIIKVFDTVWHKGLLQKLKYDFLYETLVSLSYSSEIDDRR